MVGLEVVVRPVVLPNIRPAPARSLPPQDDPESGFCVIKGNGGHHVDLTYSHSMSMSKSVPVETERRVDVARVYQMDDDGKVNKDNFVDIEVANRIKTEGGNEPAVDDSAGGGGEFTPGVGSDMTKEEIVTYYKKVKEAENIKIKEADKQYRNEPASRP